MTRPRLLDLFCGPGGATVGYQRAGFDVVGVDIERWECYPGDQWEADAFAVLRGEIEGLAQFDAIHASPPCHAFSSVTASVRASKAGSIRRLKDYPDLLGPTIEALAATGKPWVVENVPGAPGPWDVTLCGTMFGLPVRRHRLFKFGGWNGPWMPPMACNHGLTDPAAASYYGSKQRRALGIRQVEAERALLDAMGLNWVPVYAYENRVQPGSIEGIPPAYTEWIGSQLIAFLVAKVARP